jgi:hypothetical protein
VTIAGPFDDSGSVICSVVCYLTERSEAASRRRSPTRLLSLTTAERHEVRVQRRASSTAAVAGNVTSSSRSTALAPILGSPNSRRAPSCGFFCIVAQHDLPTDPIGQVIEFVERLLSSPTVRVLGPGSRHWELLSAVLGDDQVRRGSSPTPS